MLRKILVSLVGVILGVMLGVGVAFAQEHGAAPLKGWGVYLSSALAVGIPGLATGYAQAKIGAAGAGALAENRALFVPVMVLVAIPETTVILGFVASILLLVM